jgi:hypothetical protein
MLICCAIRYDEDGNIMADEDADQAEREARAKVG